MEICKFCQTNEANKKNTHYLTDAIIRTCLNIEGSNNREKGLYFSINSMNPFMEYNFQRLDEQTIENTIGRKPTEEEIERAKSIPYSVDYVFCSECEKKFTEIEVEFIEKVLPKFRTEDLTGILVMSIKENIIARNFFYLQIFRSAVCEELYSLPDEFVEKLRIILFEKLSDTSIPLAVTYLQTTGGQEMYTENFVGYTDDKNPYVIFMNDFIIQCFDSNENIKLVELYGLNNENYNDFINIDESKFIFNVFQNNDRRRFLNELTKTEKVKQTIIFFENIFDQIWLKIFGVNAPTFQKKRFVHILTETNDNLIGFSQKEIYKFTLTYLVNLFGIKE